MTSKLLFSALPVLQPVTLFVRRITAPFASPIRLHLRQAIEAVAFLSLTLLSASTHASDYSVVVAGRVESISRLNRDETDNVFPWERLDCDPEPDEHGLQCILVSNSCGFAEITYRVESGDTVEHIPEYMTVRVQLGEWCKVGKYVFEKPTALVLRRWENTYYLTGHVELVTDEKENFYVPPGAFAEYEDLERYFENFVPGPYSCWEIEYLSEHELRQMRKYRHIAWNEKKVCPEMGIPLDRFKRIYSVERTD